MATKSRCCNAPIKDTRSIQTGLTTGYCSKCGDTRFVYKVHEFIKTASVGVGHIIGGNMKKAALSVLMLFALVGFGRADEFKIWRGSYTTTSEQDAFIATGSVIIHSVSVLAGSPASSIQFFSGIGASTSAWPPVAVAISTPRFTLDTSTDTRQFVFDLVISTPAYKKTGSANLLIEWDWWNFGGWPGQINRGRGW